MTIQPIQLDAAHFDSKARQWDDNPLFRKRGLKVEAVARSASRFKPGDAVYFCNGGTGGHPATTPIFIVVATAR